jgi:cyclohexanecarboxylate-CoA ligase
MVPTESPSEDRVDAYRDAGLWLDLPLARSFLATAATRDRALALIDPEQTLSFRELAACVRRCASGLQALGVRRGDAVAYRLPNWWEAAVTLLASTALGARSVPIVPILRAREITQILGETRPRVVVTAAADRGGSSEGVFAEAFAASGIRRPLLVVARGARPHAGESFASLLEGEEIVDLPEIDPDDDAVVIYTSGSTAHPKGVRHTHNTLTAELRSLIAAHGLGPADRVLMPSPLTHVSGVVHGILAPALLGTSAVLMDRWEPGAALAAIARHRVTYLIGAPTFLQEMLAHPEIAAADLSSLRLYACGGASVPAELMRAGRERIPNLVTKRSYGSSEFPTIATTTAEDAIRFGLDTEGRALPCVEIRICGSDGEPVARGAEGEIRARGPDCFRGYVDASLDAESFDREGFFRTGDLGTLDAGGYLRVTGRVKDIVVRKGEKISAREVEDLLAEHPAVAEVALIPLPDARTGERACACVRLRSGAAAPTLADVVAFLRGRDLTPQKLPEQLEVVSDFPRTPSGKIHKKMLREQVEAAGKETGSQH